MLVRNPLECEAFGDKGLVRYPWKDEWIYGFPGELFEEFEVIHDGQALSRRIIRVFNGNDVTIIHQIYAL